MPTRETDKKEPVGAELTTIVLSKNSLALIYIHLFKDDVVYDPLENKKVNIKEILPKEFYSGVKDYSEAIKQNIATIVELITDETEKDDLCMETCPSLGPTDCRSCFVNSSVIYEIGDQIYSLVDFTTGNLVNYAYTLLLFYKANEKNPDKDNLIVPFADLDG